MVVAENDADTPFVSVHCGRGTGEILGKPMQDTVPRSFTAQPGQVGDKERTTRQYAASDRCHSKLGGESIRAGGFLESGFVGDG